jgi:UDPglucose 6-dehydrogenase
MNNFKKIYPHIEYGNTLYDTLRGTDCCVILTDWNEFKQINWNDLSSTMKEKNIVDARNLYEKEKVQNV